MYVEGCKRYRTLRRKSMYRRPRFAGRAWSSELLVRMASGQSVEILGQDSRGRYSIETRNFESFKIRKYILNIGKKSEKERKHAVGTCTLLPHYFASSTKPPLWESILIKFGFLIWEAFWKIMRKKSFNIFFNPLRYSVAYICNTFWTFLFFHIFHVVSNVLKQFKAHKKLHSIQVHMADFVNYWQANPNLKITWFM